MRILGFIILILEIITLIITIKESYYDRKTNNRTFKTKLVTMLHMSHRINGLLHRWTNKSKTKKITPPRSSR